MSIHQIQFHANSGNYSPLYVKKISTPSAYEKSFKIHVECALVVNIESWRSEVQYCVVYSMQSKHQMDIWLVVLSSMILCNDREDFLHCVVLIVAC